MTRRHLFIRAASAVAAPMVNLGRCQLFGATGQVYSTKVVDLVARSLVIDMLGLLTHGLAEAGAMARGPFILSIELISIRFADPASMFCTPLWTWSQADPFAATSNAARTTGRDSSIGIPTASVSFATAGTWLRQSRPVAWESSSGCRIPSISDPPPMFALFYAKGQRISQLTYNSLNRLGSGCGERNDSGLSDFGAEIVQAMDACGMAIDVSHASERTTLDAIEASSKPLLITHSNCRALVKHPRCKSDDVIRALATKGGVMGITGVGAFLSSRRSPSIEDVLDHFDHVASLVGVEHLGIGSDAGVDEGPSLPHLQVRGLRQSRRVFDLTAGLVRRRYSDASIEAILGQEFPASVEETIGFSRLISSKSQ